MTDLKTDFEDWSVKQGLAETTIYEYARRIDKICKTIYKNHDVQPWQQLAQNIYPVLGFHLLCKNGEVRTTSDNIAKVKDFLIQFLYSMSSYKENIKDYFIVEFLSKGDSITNDYTTNDYTTIDILLPFLTNEIITFKISNLVTQQGKNRNALETFYQFLSETGYKNSGFSYYKNIVEKKDIKKFYTSLSKKIIDISSSLVDTNKNLKLMSRINGGTSLIPPQIDNSVDTEVYRDTVREILHISIRTLKRLAVSGDLVALENGNYSVEIVNQYIKERFVSSKYHCSTIKLDKWWTVDEAHEQTGIHRKKLQRLRHSNPEKNEVAYIRSSPTVYIYYPNDVKRKA